jgi:hypothetical protein
MPDTVGGDGESHNVVEVAESGKQPEHLREDRTVALGCGFSFLKPTGDR